MGPWSSDRALALRTDEPALVPALRADPVEELLLHGGVVAVADDGHHVTAIITEVLDRALPRHVPLVCHQGEQDDHEKAEDRRDDQTSEVPGRFLQGQEREEAHRPSIRRFLLKMAGGFSERSLSGARLPSRAAGRGGAGAASPRNPSEPRPRAALPYRSTGRPTPGRPSCDLG